MTNDDSESIAESAAIARDRREREENQPSAISVQHSEKASSEQLQWKQLEFGEAVRREAKLEAQRMIREAVTRRANAGLVPGGRVERELAERGESGRVMCGKVRGDGRRCRYPAAPEAFLCAAHLQWEQSAYSVMGLEFPDDAMALQMMSAKVMGMVATKRIDERQARTMAQFLRVMERNLAAVERQFKAAEWAFWE